MRREGSLAQLQAAIDGLPPRRARQLMVAWGRDCPVLAGAGLRTPSEIPGWLPGLSWRDRDAVLRHLVELAQGGDELAVIAVLVCLRPGICAMASAGSLVIDDVVCELTAVVLAFPLARRRSVARQLLLDTRKRLVHREVARAVPEGDTRWHLEEVEAPGELGAGDRGAERLSELVLDAWRAGLVSEDAARLVLLTRVWGQPMAVAAERLGIGTKAAFARRARAEARIAKSQG